MAAANANAASDAPRLRAGLRGCQHPLCGVSAQRHAGREKPDQELRPAKHAQGQGAAGQRRRPAGANVAKGRHHLPERPGGCCAQMVPVPFLPPARPGVSASNPTTVSSAAGVSVITCVDWAKRIGSTPPANRPRPPLGP